VLELDLARVPRPTEEVLGNTEAEVMFDEATGQPDISLAFTPEGADLFARVTEAHVKERLAIAVEGDVLSAPVRLLEERLGGG